MTESLDWRRLPDILRGALAALRSKQDEVNRLNVYPVPDGDTGTNMVLTMESVIAEVTKADPSLSEISRAATLGSLMGARGNSGVILSQMIRGFFEIVGERDKIDAGVLVEAMNGSTKVAYQAVRKPVEGTMLTVLKDASEAISNLTDKLSVEDVLEIAVHAAEESVKRTPELLPVLKEAGVVDAGGYGLVAMIKGALAVLQNTAIEAATEDIGEGALEGELSLEFAYCTEMVVKGKGLERERMEKEIEQLGDSILVVGTPEMLKIHIHTNNPGRVLEAATTAGSLSHVQINNMVEQAADRARMLASAAESKGIAVVAVASGEGVRRVFESMGVKAFVSGGQSMNPSTAEILDAVESLSNPEIIILPNNKNIVLAAQQVVDLAAGKIAVVPTKSIVEGLSAMLGFNPELDLAANEAAMLDCASAVRTGEVTIAVRDANGIKKGEYIGMLNGGIPLSGTDLLDTAMGLLERMTNGGGETVTILAGKDVSDEALAELESKLTERHPELEVDIIRGDQPVYHFIIGVE